MGHPSGTLNNSNSHSPSRLDDSFQTSRRIGFEEPSRLRLRRNPASGSARIARLRPAAPPPRGCDRSNAACRRRADCRDFKAVCQSAFARRPNWRVARRPPGGSSSSDPAGRAISRGLFVHSEAGIFFCPSPSGWRTEQDLHLQPTDYQPVALLLSYLSGKPSPFPMPFSVRAWANRTRCPARRRLKAAYQSGRSARGVSERALVPIDRCSNRRQERGSSALREHASCPRVRNGISI